MNDKIPSILLNHDFYNKPRNRLWIAENGAEAVIILQTVWLASSQERECKIKEEEALVLPYPLPFSIDKIKSVLVSAVSVGLLDYDDGHYFNSQIVADQQQFQVKRENYRKGKEKRDQTISKSFLNPDRILEETKDKPSKIILNPEYEYERECEDLKIDDITKEQVLLSWKHSGLDESDMPNALSDLARHYKKNNICPPKTLGQDLCASWMVTLQAKRKTAQASLHRVNSFRINGNGSSSPPPRGLSEESLKKLEQQFGKGAA